MDIKPAFDTVWNSVEDLDVPREIIEWCPYARKFGEWVSARLEAFTEPEITSVNQAKVLLIDKYFEWRNCVPKNHRNHIGSGGHRCIYQVFEQTYERLKILELSLTPPMLFLPPPPPPPPQIAGIFLGST